MKKIEVVAAVIVDGDKILATQRGYGEFKGKWEFPGGKIEQNEDKKHALKREIKEELNVDVNVNDYITTVEWQYPNFFMTLHAFYASIDNGSLELIEHLDKKWLSKDQLDSVDWISADIDIVKIIKN